jgi:cation diffusion facilitator family transporter
LNGVPDKCRKCGRKVPLITLVSNLALGGVKTSVGCLTGSVGLTVDGFHSMADGIGSIFVLASLRIAEKPRDASHPYGHGKVEFVASLIIFTTLIGVGIIFLIESVVAMMIGWSKVPGMLAFLVALLSVVANYIMYHLNHCAGTKLNSPSLIANGFENLTDLFSSIPVAIGIVFAELGFPLADPLAGALVSVFIITNASREWWHHFNNLMDRSAPKGTLRKIRSMAMSVAGVSDLGNVRTRRVGQNLWVDLEIVVSPKCSVTVASKIADKVRELLLRKAKHVEDVVVYYQSSIPGEARISSPAAER